MKGRCHGGVHACRRRCGARSWLGARSAICCRRLVDRARRLEPGRHRCRSRRARGVRCQDLRGTSRRPDRVVSSARSSAISDSIGVPDVCIYNVSIYQSEPALELSLDALRLAVDIHIVGALNTAQTAFAPAMRAVRRGRARVHCEQPRTRSRGDVCRVEHRQGCAAQPRAEPRARARGHADQSRGRDICGPIKAGTAYDPDLLADVYWEIATQDPAHFERDRLVQA